jgi:hypothetical protein
MPLLSLKVVLDSTHFRWKGEALSKVEQVPSVQQWYHELTPVPQRHKRQSQSSTDFSHFLVAKMTFDLEAFLPLLLAVDCSG